MFIKLDMMKVYRAIEYGKDRNLKYGFHIDREKEIIMLYDYENTIIHLYDPQQKVWFLIGRENVERMKPNPEDYEKKMKEFAKVKSKQASTNEPTRRKRTVRSKKPRTYGAHVSQRSQSVT